MQKLAKYTFVVLSVLPLVQLFNFYLFVLRTKLQMGQWPSYGSPDPKDLSFDIQFASVWIITVIIFFATPVWVVSGFYSAWQRMFTQRNTLLLAGLFLLTVVGLMLTPEQLVSWYLD